MAVKPKNQHLRRPICTWVNVLDYQMFHDIAVSNGVTIAAYLRAMVIDVLAEETQKSSRQVDGLNNAYPVDAQGLTSRPL